MSEVEAQPLSGISAQSWNEKECQASKIQSVDESELSQGKPCENGNAHPSNATEESPVVRPSLDIRPSVDTSRESLEKTMQRHETLSETKKTSVLQKQLHKKLLNRLDVGANTCKTLRGYFVARSNIALSHAQLLGQLPRIHPLGEMGTLENGLELLQTISTQERDSSTLFSQKVVELVEKPLVDMYNELIDKRAQIALEAQQHHKDIDTLFDRVSRAYTAFRSSVTEARKLSIEKKEVTADPYLKQVQYCEVLNQLHLAQNNYNAFLQQFYQDMEALDIKRIELLQSLMRNYTQIQRTFFSKLTSVVDSAADSVAEIKAEEDWGGFQHHKTHNKDYVDILPEVITRDPGEMLQTRSVIRSGHLEFGGKPYFGVLTEFGFLHYFTSPQQLVPENSIPLQRVSKLSQADDRHFHFEYQPSGWFTSAHPYEFGVLQFDAPTISAMHSSTSSEQASGSLYNSSSTTQEDGNVDAWMRDLKRFVKDTPATAPRK